MISVTVAGGLSMLAAMVTVSASVSIETVVGSWIGLGILAAFLAMIGRTMVVPLATMLPLMLGLSSMIQAMLPWARVLPDRATLAVFVGPQTGLLSPGTGGGVLAGSVVISAVGAWGVWTRSEVR